MERDWYRRVMLKLAEARESPEGDFLQTLDSELDDLSMGLEDLRKQGGMTSYSVKRGLNLLNDLRGKLENAQNGQDVRQAFFEVDAVRDLIEEARQAVADRERGA